MLQKWRNHGAITYAGYILGFPADTKELIARDIEIIKRELPIDILEFFFPNSAARVRPQDSLDKGVWMDPDMNKYDLNHRVCHHSTMSDADGRRPMDGRGTPSIRLTTSHDRAADMCQQGRPPRTRYPPSCGFTLPPLRIGTS